MKKHTIRALIAAAIVLAVYNLVAFVAPFEHTAAFWLSYVFALAAFVVMAASVYIAFVKKGDVKSRFYGFPIARIGVVYYAMQLAASLIVMALAKIIPWWIPTLAYGIAFGAALIGLIGAEAIVDEINTQDSKQKKDTTLMLTLQSKVSRIAAESDDASLKKLADEFCYSDPVSSEAIADSEAELAVAVDELRAAFADGNSEDIAKLTRKTSALLAERNRLCKLNKK